MFSWNSFQSGPQTQNVIDKPWIDIHFNDSIIDIISFDSNNLDSILENCTKHKLFVIFTCITLHFLLQCSYDPLNPLNLIIFLSENWSFSIKILF